MNPHITYYLPFLGHQVTEEALGMCVWGGETAFMRLRVTYSHALYCGTVAYT